MDIVHHTLIGGVGFIAGIGGGNELAGAAFLAGSVLPDLDVFLMIFGKRFYLRNHQGPTHSLILSPIFASLIAVPLLYLSEFNFTIAAAALFGLWVHIFLDWINTFGISLFWPVTPKRFSLNAVFFIDISYLSSTPPGLENIFIYWILPMFNPFGIDLYYCLFRIYINYKDTEVFTLGKYCNPKPIKQIYSLIRE